MKPEFTEDGINVQTFEEIYDELVAGYQSIYGSDILLDSDTPDGQRVGIEAQARLDLQSYALAIYNQMDPDFAVGEALNKIIKISGIMRIAGARSYASVTIETSEAVTLPDGYTVKDTSEQNWITLSEVELISGTNTTTLYSEDFGVITAGIGEINDPSTYIIGVTSVTNAAAATTGNDEETDAELRVRRNASLVIPETSAIGGLYTALWAVSDVLEVKIYENDTDSTDSLTVPAHSIWLIIDGGLDADIAKVMAEVKTAGTGMKGTEEVTYNETITMADGATITYSHEMKFDRVSTKDVYIKMTLTRTDPAIPVVTSAVKAALVAKTYSIGQFIQANNLYSTVYGAGDTFVATDLEISFDDITYTDAELTPDYDERVTITDAKITITEVT